MPKVGHEMFMLAGARFFFEEERSGVSTPLPVVDLGNVKEFTPNIEQTLVEAFDASRGVKSKVASEVSERTEAYEVTLENLNLYNLGLFYGANLETFTQAATAETDVKHYAHPGQWFSILNDDYDASAPARVYNVDDQQTFTIKDDNAGSPGTAFNAADITVDYERGLAKVAASVHVAAGDVYLSFTPKAVSGKLLLKPQKEPLVRQGKVELWIGQENMKFFHVRSAKCEVQGSNLNLSVDEFSTVQFTVTIVDDIDDTTEPAGRFITVGGTPPDAVGPDA